jgi:DNA-binding transcriptional ArsR family regulator
MIDRIREDIEQRLEQLLAEADKLRQALSALGSDGNGQATTRRRSGSGGASTATRARTRARSSTPPAGRRATRTTSAAPAARQRSASGGTRRAVLETLAKAGGQPLTAGQVASATGLGRPSVSTTLSKLARSGDVIKAERGYAIAPGGQK